MLTSALYKAAGPTPNWIRVGQRLTCLSSYFKSPNQFKTICKKKMLARNPPSPPGTTDKSSQ